LTPTAPSWGDIAAFLAADGWRELPHRGGGRQRHLFYEEALAGGRVLQTQISHSGRKTLSPGRFSSILGDLEVSRDAFWECIRAGEPVDRPVVVEDAPVEHEAWVVGVLVSELHLSADEIEALTPERARRIVEEHWSRPR